MKVRKKPVIVEVGIFEEYQYPYAALREWVASFGDRFEDKFLLEEPGHKLKVKTLEGTSYDVDASDVIIRGIKGEYYPL